MESRASRCSSSTMARLRSSSMHRKRIAPDGWGSTAAPGECRRRRKARERVVFDHARVRGYAYLAGSAVFHYLGPAFAVLLFGLVPPAGVAWLRIATAAVIYAAWRRPWRR